MDDALNTIQLGDCITHMDRLPASSVDLAFADPPFNIGYDYDVYEDSVEHQQYIDWSKRWISSVSRVLKPTGTFWLAIGDEYAAELKLASQAIGFHCRSWVIWYYTFGVNCSKKFTRSHAHLFHFVKDPETFTFRDDDLDNRVPSARELVYNDKRANPKGRLPDDTWIIRPADVVGELVSDDDGIWSPGQVAPLADCDRTFTLRPQDLDSCFTPNEDTWYFPRVAGTFKERAGFHGCQMPEQLLGRIIRACSHPGEVVLDPFSGSATTLAVAKKLGRHYIGFDVSDDYVQYGVARLRAIKVGDRLDGSPEPLKSAPKTGQRYGKRSRKEADRSAAERTEDRYDQVQLELTLHGVAEAFARTHDGFSADRVVADPLLNEQFVDACARLDLVGDAQTWNMLLFRLRKAGELVHLPTDRRTSYSWEQCDPYLFASEIAWQLILKRDQANSLDAILCDPTLVREFDSCAARLAPGFQPLDYRWAALKIRKEAKFARGRAAVLKAPSRFSAKTPLADLSIDELPERPGLYIMCEGPKSNLYAGESVDLRRRLAITREHAAAWSEVAPTIHVRTMPLDSLGAGKLAWQSCMVNKFKPRLNCAELCSI